MMSASTSVKYAPIHDKPAGLEALEFSERVSSRARAIRVEVRADGRVLLVIPRFVARRDAHEFLRSRRDWVLCKLEEMQRRPRKSAVPPLRWDGTDTLPLRGIPTRLALSGTLHKGNGCVRFGDAIELHCRAARNSSAERARILLRGLRELARRESLQLLDRESARLQVSFSGPRIADQRSLWGSCTPAGLISLNWRLILAPTEVLRYVVVHELCHRRHLNHSARFWRLVESQMPDFEIWRAWLREHGADLHGVLPGRVGKEPRTFDPLDDAL